MKKLLVLVVVVLTASTFALNEAKASGDGTEPKVYGFFSKNLEEDDKVVEKDTKTTTCNCDEPFEVDVEEPTNYKVGELL